MWLSPAQQLLSSTLRGGPLLRRFHAAAKPGQFFPSVPGGYRIKRFYKRVDVVEHPLSAEAPKLAAGEKIDFKNLSKSHGSYWAVTLDGKVTKTMYKDNLLIPCKAMAVALAEEWDSQHESINLKSLHLVSQANEVICVEQLPGQVH
jgi:ATP12 chaperone protein